MACLASWWKRLLDCFGLLGRANRPARAMHQSNRFRPCLEVLEDRTLPSGTGLLGQYFAGESFTSLVASRVDSQVNFNWSSAAPIAGLAQEHYSVRWTGQLEALQTGATMFYLYSDDGVRLTINGTTVIDAWASHPLREDRALVNLVAGQKYTVELEYHQNSGTAAVRLAWMGPGIPWQYIPASQLYPNSPPTATLAAANVTAAGGTTYTFSVSYRDDGSLDLTSLSSGDVKVAGPQSFSQLATYVGVSGGSGAWTATYRISPPGGSWDNGDNGTYTVALEKGAVADSLHAVATGGTLGTFQVSILDWFSQNLKDPGIANLTRTLAADGSIARADMLAIFTQVEPNGVTATELTDLRTIVVNAAYLRLPDFVRNLTNKVVNGNPANAHYQGQALGNLAAGSTADHLHKLVDKWFRGTDRPAVDAPGLTYTWAAGNLWVSTGPAYSDVKQGRLSDCFFVAALSEIASRSPQSIKDAFIDNGDGTWTIRFWNNSTADYVTVDRYLPASSTGTFWYAGKGASLTDPNNKLWAALLEKGYAQLAESGWSRPSAVNAYVAIENGWEGNVIKQVAGKAAYSAGIYNSTIILNSLVNAFNSGKMLLLHSMSSTAPGIVSNHVYAVVGYNALTQTFKLWNVWGYHQDLTWAQVAANFDSYTYT